MDKYYVLYTDFSFIGKPSSSLYDLLIIWIFYMKILFDSVVNLRCLFLLMKLYEWDGCVYNRWYGWIPSYNDICCLWMWLVIWVDVFIYNISWSFCTSIWHDKVTGFEMAKYKFGINQILFKFKFYMVKAFVYLETNITSVHRVYRNGPRAYDHWNGPVSRDVRARLTERLYISETLLNVQI